MMGPKVLLDLMDLQAHLVYKDQRVKEGLEPVIQAHQEVKERKARRATQHLFPRDP